MFGLLVALHILIALVLMLVILLQSGKAGDLASTFGGATSQAAFGARGAATVLTKATAIFAVLFLLSSLSLAILYSREGGSTVMDSVPAPAPTQGQTTPAAPEGGGEAPPQEQQPPAPQQETPPSGQQGSQ